MFNKWFWFKLWLKRFRIYHVGPIFFMFKLGLLSNHGVWEWKLGVSFRSDKYWQRDSYSSYELKERKGRSIRFDFLIGYTEFGDFGKQKDT